MQFKLNDSVLSYLSNEHIDIWNNILENNISAVLSIVQNQAEQKETSLLSTIIAELFSYNKSETLDGYDLNSVKEGNGIIFSDLVRLVMTLDINGNYEILRQQTADKLVKSMDMIVENIQKESNGYPKSPVQAFVWHEASNMRSAFSGLAYYYKQKEFFDAEMHAVVKRTQITLAIMGHYKHMVGPDMIESAQLMEKANDVDTALVFYEAVKKDFEDELSFFIEYPDQGASDDDRSILQSLKTACSSLDRIKETTQFENLCLQIDEILEREFVEVNFDEEDDE